MTFVRMLWAEPYPMASTIGIYDLAHGLCVCGQETGRFAVDAIAMWWDSEGRAGFVGSDKLLILADAGGSNGYRPRLRKQQLQESA